MQKLHPMWSIFMVAIDRSTWNSIKAELITMWQIVTDYQTAQQQQA
jgi:hypothetical protein